MVSLALERGSGNGGNAGTFLILAAQGPRTTTDTSFLLALKASGTGPLAPQPQQLDGMMGRLDNQLCDWDRERASPTYQNGC